MTSPVVSVLVPTNVHTPWLDQAVASLIEQSGATIEIVVVHDGIKPDPRLSWVHNPRVRCVTNNRSRGVAWALNLGASHCSGEFIARLDGDDVALPGRLSTQIDYLRRHPAAVVVGSRAHLIDVNGKRLGRLGTAPAGECDVRPLLLKRNAIVHSSAMFRRADLEAVGGYRSALRQMEDYDLWLRMAHRGEVHVLADELVQYRLHGGQLSRGAPATGPHISAVLKGRRALARLLNFPMPLQLARDGAWWAAQVARRQGWRPAGYSRFLESKPD